MPLKSTAAVPAHSTRQRATDMPLLVLSPSKARKVTKKRNINKLRSAFKGFSKTVPTPVPQLSTRSPEEKDLPEKRPNRSAAVAANAKLGEMNWDGCRAESLGDSSFSPETPLQRVLAALGVTACIPAHGFSAVASEKPENIRSIELCIKALVQLLVPDGTLSAKRFQKQDTPASNLALLAMRGQGKARTVALAVLAASCSQENADKMLRGASFD
jgi:hypothetical protein